MSNYNLTAIKMNVDLGSTKKVIDQYNALVKQLETKHVKLEIDVSSIKAGVGLATSEIEKAYQKMANEAKKAKEEMSKPVKFDYKNSIIDNSSIDKFRQSLAQIRTDIKDISNVKVTYGKNESGNGLGRIDSAVVTYTNNMNKLITETMAWAETTDKATGEQTRRWQTISVVVNENRKALDTLTAASEKFKANMSGKITGIEIGKDSSWATQLSQFETLKTKMEQLKNFKLDGNNIKEYRSLVGEVASAYASCKNEMTRVKNEQQQLSQTSAINDRAINKVRDFNTQLDLLRSKYKDIDSNPMFQQIVSDVERLNSTPPTQFNNSVNQINNSMRRLRSEMSATTSNGIGLFKSLGNSIKSAFSFMTGATLVYSFANQIRQIPKIVKEVDTSLVEFNKVANISESQLKSFTETAYKTGETLGKTGSDVIDATTEFVKAGYNIQQSTELAKSAMLSMNVGTGMNDMELATNSLIATLKGFEMQASDSSKVVDTMSKVADTTAIGYSELADGIQRVSAVMNQGDTSFEETLGLLTSTYELSRNIEKSATGINTISQRMRGLKLSDSGDLEKDAELLGKVENKLKTIAGVDLMGDDGQLRSTFDVLQDLSKVWGTLNKNQKQYLTETLAGNRQNTVLAQILQNWEAVDKSIQSAAESTGYAQEVNERYLNSIQGRMASLQSSWQKLATTTLDSELFKGVISFTDGVVKLTTACGGLIPVLLSAVGTMITFKAISMSTTKGFSGLIGGFKALTASLFTVSEAQAAATTSAIALSAAHKLLVGFGVTTAIMGFSAIIYAIAKSSEKAKEKVSNLTDEISKIREVTNSTKGLAEEFEKLSKKTNLNSEESKRLYEVQNQIKELQPEIGGYYDEQGNFIITQVSSAQELLEVQKQILQTKRDELALASKKTLDDDIAKYNRQKETLDKIADNKEKIARLDELAAKGELTRDESTEFQNISTDLVSQGIKPAQIDKMIKDAKQQMEDGASSIRDSVLSIITADDSWDSLSEGVANNMRKALSEMDSDKLLSYASNLENGKLEVEDFIKYLRFISPVLNDTSNAMDGAESSSGNYDETLKSLSERAKESAEKLDILKVAQAELLEKNDITGETMDKLIKKYPELEDEITNVEGAYSLLSKKIAENNFDKATQDVGDLTSILEDLEAGNGITSSSFKKLSSSFPELLKYMNDEHDLANAITEKMNELKDTQTEAYKQMLMNDENYYQNKILMDNEWVTNTETNINALFTGLGSAYKLDLDNYKSLEEAKGKVTSELIKELAGAWAKYFDTTSGVFDMQGFGVERSNFASDGEYFATLGRLAGYQKQIQEAANRFKEISIDPIDIKVGGTKASSKSKSDDAFQKAIDRIKQAREEIEREIDLLQEKMNLAELTGDTKAFDDYANKMTVLLTKLKGVSAQEVSGYEELLKKFTKEDEQLELNQLIMESNTKKYSDEQTYINQSIDLINRKYDLEKRVYDDKLRQLNIEQSLMKENGEAYQQAEQEKINLLLSNQSSYMQKVKQLRDMGFSDQQEEVRKYIDLWYDAKEEILSIEKSLAEQRKSIFKETLQNQQTQTENLISMTMSMLRDRYNEEKKLIEENAKAEEDALKAKLDGYRKIIEAKKKELQDEASEEDYNDGLKEKQKEIADLKNQASLLSMDETSKDKYEKLLEEIASKEKELKKYQRDYNLNIQQETLDKELEQYEENINSQIDAVEKQKDSELDIIEKSLNNEVKLRAEAIKLIESKNKDLYNKLLAWSEEYGTKTKDEITEAWEGANSALETYGGTAQSVLDTLKLMAEKMKEIDNSNWTDWTNGSGNVNSNDFASSSGSSSSSSLSSKAKEQLNQQKYLHDQMVIANETNNEGLKKWVQEQRKKYGLDPKTGAIVKQWHTGINNGRIDGLKADETILKALNNEWIITNDQYNNLKKNLDGISNRNAGGNITIEVGSLMNGVTIEKGVDVDNILKKANDMFLKTLKSTLNVRGVK